MRTLKYTLLGGLVVGTLDALDAMIFFGLRGAKPGRIFQGIAAGLIGPAARDGGMPTVVLGIGLHYFIATMIVLVCVLLSRGVPVLRRHLIPAGMVYGLAAFLVMYLVVIPHSATGGGGLPRGAGLANALLIHMLGVGVPAAFAARAAAAKRR
ncbi:MAG: hypothetical protein ABI051_10750 [Vicinamibacterales bacterium]